MSSESVSFQEFFRRVQAEKHARAPKCGLCGRPEQGYLLRLGDRLSGNGKSGQTEYRGGHTQTPEEAGLCCCSVLTCIYPDHEETETYRTYDEACAVLEGFAQMAVETGWAVRRSAFDLVMQNPEGLRVTVKLIDRKRGMR